MTATHQHIEDLDLDTWAAVTRHAAADAVAAAERRGVQPPAELVTVAAMTHHELVEHRTRSGPAPRHLSPMMQLVEADRLRAVAERHARDANQDKQDAEAAAWVAQAEAEECARGATAARERARAAEAQSARRDAERAAERTADQDERATERAAAEERLQQLRVDLERARADAAAEVAAAREQSSGAHARAEQRAAERASERAAAEEALQQLRGQLEQTRADAAAEVAAAREQASGAHARAEQRAAERAAERAAAEEALQQLRGELEQVRADASVEVAAAREQAARAHARAEQRAAERAAERRSAEEAMQQVLEQARANVAAEVAAAHAQAGGEVTALRQAAEAEVARARAEADAARRQAQGQAPQLLAIPIAPLEVRQYTWRIENALTTLHQIDYLLEAGLAEQRPVDIELLRNLAWTVREPASNLSHELGNLAQYISQSQMAAAAGYPGAAASAYRAFLRRIETATQLLGNRDGSRDAEVVEVVNEMLAALRAQDTHTPPRI